MSRITTVHPRTYNEARVIGEVTETFARNEGKPPKGWMGAGTYENSTTPDLLKEAGYRLAEEHAFLPNQYFLIFKP